MSPTATVWLVIVICGALTFAIRASFVLVADRFEGLSSETMELLRMIPAAAIAALVAPAVLRPGGELVVFGPRPIAAALALAVAAWTRSILWTIVVGLVAVTALEWAFA
ncbi:MAG: AzlD domain-containing protein [Nitriliruptoraceae bacterium]|nr:AzlD domain-containing protein [Nitriliruptoraceae bacterium]